MTPSLFRLLDTSRQRSHIWFRGLFPHDFLPRSFAVRWKDELEPTWHLLHFSGNMHSVTYNQNLVSQALLVGWIKLREFYGLTENHQTACRTSSTEEKLVNRALSSKETRFGINLFASKELLMIEEDTEIRQWGPELRADLRNTMIQLPGNPVWHLTGFYGYPERNRQDS
ncbi:hypothetical protein JHK86_039905 [Glycine max]|nr:hypothetical protein JHK86_039905 [Glycine max]